jgi:hypothetical protein
MVEVGREGVAYDLVFPDVFYPEGRVGERSGFHAVVGNPPWDAIQFKSKEFLAAFDLAILDAPTARERAAAEERIMSNPAVSRLCSIQQQGFEQQKRVNDRLYRYQKLIIDGDLAGRQLDAFRVFMERNAQLVRGVTGVVVPSAFHANAGAAGVRRLYLEDLALECCYSFENRRRFFDIHSSFKFALVVARRDGTATRSFKCAFYIHDAERLFDNSDGLNYSREFVERTGGPHLTLLELRSPADAMVAGGAWERNGALGDVLAAMHLQFRMTELHLSHDAFRFVDSATRCHGDPRAAQVRRMLCRDGFLVLYEGKHFNQFEDVWGAPPRYLVPVAALVEKSDYAKVACYYRLAFREVASSTNERTVIAAMLGPGVVTGHTAPVDQRPAERPNLAALWILVVMNSFVFDWLVRLKAASHVTKFVLEATPVPEPSGATRRLLAHSALRLTCNHEGYAPLWREQLGDAWREPTPRHTWPVLAGDDARWAVRAAIDAVVADAYGLTRDQYAHVLSTFSHKSYPRAPERCLAAFDELLRTGLDAFVQAHDPYADVPLNESLPRPVIDLPIPGAAAPGAAIGESFQLQPSEPKRRGRKKGG